MLPWRSKQSTFLCGYVVLVHFRHLDVKLLEELELKAVKQLLLCVLKVHFGPAAAHPVRVFKSRSDGPNSSWLH